jgi:hypothetical protein
VDLLLRNQGLTLPRMVFFSHNLDKDPRRGCQVCRNYMFFIIYFTNNRSRKVAGPSADNFRKNP